MRTTRTATGFAAALIALAAAAGALFWHSFPKTPGAACTLEAKLCPDGSYVGRTGPACKFAPCPEATSTGAAGAPEGFEAKNAGGISGIVLLGPVCPVERIPPDPRCAPRPYQTALIVTLSRGTQAVKRFSSGADGRFLLSLPPGSYAISPAPSASPFPRCGSVSPIKVSAGKFADATISCDTGIR